MFYGSLHNLLFYNFHLVYENSELRQLIPQMNGLVRDLKSTLNNHKKEQLHHSLSLEDGFAFSVGGNIKCELIFCFCVVSFDERSLGPRSSNNYNIQN
jgi:hypothetical protein